MSIRNTMYRIPKKRWEYCLEVPKEKIENLSHLNVEKDLCGVQLQSDFATDLVIEAYNKGKAKEFSLEKTEIEKCDITRCVFDKECFLLLVEMCKEKVSSIFSSIIFTKEDNRKYYASLFKDLTISDKKSQMIKCPWIWIDCLYELFWIYKTTDWENEVIFCEIS